MTTLFAFQILPGADESFGYCASLEQAKAEAQEHRQEIERGGEEDGETETILPTVELLLPVLNERRTLTEALVEEMTQVAVVE